MKPNRVWVLVVAAVALVVTSCGGGGSSTRSVLVDFSHDEFATFVAKYFPAKIQVTPGQTIDFHQTWTGEPHTVTGGTAINDSMQPALAWLTIFENYTSLQGQNDMVDPENAGDARWSDFAAKLKAANPRSERDAVLNAWRSLRAKGVRIADLDNPPDMAAADALKTVDESSGPAFENLLFIGDDEGSSFQNVAQPCFLKSGAVPKPTAEPCSRAEQRQPEFDGTQAFYNSGVLHYEGAGGNTYKVKIADNAKPGTYFFYCAVHGPSQRTEVEIKKAGTKVPSQGEVSRQARAEIDTILKPMSKTFARARDKGTVDLDGKNVKGPFAGLPVKTESSINEFVPKRMTVKANEPITWKVFGRHTISFRPPRYLPIIDFTKKKIETNPKLSDPAGGAPKPPELGPDEHGIPKFDAGTYGGRGFWSSGLVGADADYYEYTVKISKPGTYNYACLVHPPMVGTIVVTAA